MPTFNFTRLYQFSHLIGCASLNNMLPMVDIVGVIFMFNKLLAVDNGQNNLQVIRDLFDKYEEIQVVTADSIGRGWEILEESYGDINVILLDGMALLPENREFLSRLKSSSKTRRIPVVVHTANSNEKCLEEEVEAGIYYHISAPYTDEHLFSMVCKAIEQYQRWNADYFAKYKETLEMIEYCKFNFRTLDEAKNLTSYLVNFYPDPEKTMLGISEMLINAVEHGNLEIGYDEKGEIFMNGTWEDEIHKRLKQKKHKNKKVNVIYKRSKSAISLKIRDEGKGFDWKKYLEMSPDRAVDYHGRGIALSKALSFDKVEYNPPGNEVVCKINL